MNTRHTVARMGAVFLMLAVAVQANELFEAVLCHDDAAVRQRLEAGDNPNRVGRWGETPLKWAVMGGQTDVARRLIAHGADLRTLNDDPLFWSAQGGLTEYLAEALAGGAGPNARHRDGRTALMKAAGGGHTPAVELLLAAGADIDAVCTNTYDLGQTALFHAAMAGRLDTVKTLLWLGADEGVFERLGVPAILWLTTAGWDEWVLDELERGADPNAANREGATALYFAAARGQTNLVRRLLEKGADPLQADNGGSTPLLCAAGSRDPETLRLLLLAAKSRKPDLDGLNRYGETVLMRAAMTGPAASVRLLLDAGARVVVTNQYGGSAWLTAADAGHVDVLELLLKRKARINQRDIAGNTALIKAAGSRRLEAVQFLLKNKADPSLRTGRSTAGECTALMEAARNGHAPVVRFLVEQGLSFRDCTTDGETSLMLAAQSGDAETIGVLVDAGVPVNETATGFWQGHTALDFAARDGKLEAARELLDRGADPNTSRAHRTALIWAAENGRLDMVKLLLRRGANPDLKGNASASAEEQARSAGHAAVAELLESRPNPDDPALDIPEHLLPPPAARAADGINELHAVRIDPQTRQVTFVGVYNPRFDTGPIPYAALLNEALKHPQPSFSLEPTRASSKAEDRALQIIAADTRRLATDDAYLARWSQRFFGTLFSNDPSLAEDGRRFLQTAARNMGVTEDEMLVLVRQLQRDPTVNEMEVVRIDGKALRHLGFPKTGTAIEAIGRDDSWTLTETLGLTETFRNMRSRVAAGDITLERASLEGQVLMYSRMLEEMNVPAARIEQLAGQVRRGQVPLDHLFASIKDLMIDRFADAMFEGQIVSGAFLSAFFKVPASVYRPVFQDVPAESHLGDILMTADVQMKRLHVPGAGSVPDLPDHFIHLRTFAAREGVPLPVGAGASVGFCLVPGTTGLRISPDSAVVAFDEPAIRIKTWRMNTLGTWSATARAMLDRECAAYADLLSASYGRLAERLTGFHRLREASKVIALARWARGQNQTLSAVAPPVPKPKPAAAIPGVWQGMFTPTATSIGLTLNVSGGASFGAEEGEDWIRTAEDRSLGTIPPEAAVRRLDNRGNVTFSCPRCGAPLRYRSDANGVPLEVEACERCRQRQPSAPPPVPPTPILPYWQSAARRTAPPAPNLVVRSESAPAVEAPPVAAHPSTHDDASVLDMSEIPLNSTVRLFGEETAARPRGPLALAPPPPSPGAKKLEFKPKETMTPDEIAAEREQILREIADTQIEARRLQATLESTSRLYDEWGARQAEAQQRAATEYRDFIIWLASAGLEQRLDALRRAGLRPEDAKKLEDFLLRAKEFGETRSFAEFAEDPKIQDGLKLLWDIAISDAQVAARLGLDGVLKFKDLSEFIVNSSFNITDYLFTRQGLKRLDQDENARDLAVTMMRRRMEQLVRRKNELSAP